MLLTCTSFFEPQAEEQCTDLVKKKKIVEEDKKKITLVIKELDEKKKQALRTAWDQVNNSFKQWLNLIIVV